MSGHRQTSCQQAPLCLTLIAWTLVVVLAGCEWEVPDTSPSSNPWGSPADENDDPGNENGESPAGSQTFSGACAPVAYLTCGQRVTGDTSDFNGGATDVIDGYPVSVGNYDGPEIAYVFEATSTETAEARFVDPRPQIINHDLFILESQDGVCAAEHAVERGFNGVEFETVAGRTYFIVVDGANGDEGAFELDLDCNGGVDGGPIDTPTVEVDAAVLMSPQAYGNSHLQRTIDALDGALTSVDFAMYSFRDGGVRHAIEDAVARGVTMRAILESARADRNDPEGSRSQWLEDMGVEVRWVNKVMHHKFAIIDGPRADLSAATSGQLITGSANWSYSAGTRYDENTLFVTGDATLNLEFQREFNLLWDNGRPFPGGEDIVVPESISVTEADIPQDVGATVVMTSPNFNVSTTSYGPTFSVVAGSEAIRAPLADFILSADHSISVASGHLRSRQITDALIEAWEANPSLDIRVYLDGQEYSSESYRDEEEQEYLDCLDEATTTTQVHHCEDRGVHFGLNLHEVGIPVRYKYYAYRWHYSYAVQQHHKYVIVDDERVASGSYNFSNNAEHDTFENIIFFEGDAYSGVIEDFVTNFETIWDTGRTGIYESLLAQITETEDDFPIVFDSMALSWPEVSELKATVLANCPNITSEDYRSDPQNHTVCER